MLTINPQTSSQPRIVGIGASAGGLPALEEFLTAIPADSGLCFVVIQHLSREHESHLTTLLDRVAKIPVLELTEDVIPQQNTVYVRPPDKNVTVDEALHLSARSTNRQVFDLVIDDFLMTLADSREEQAIGVILSGMGSDGSRGVKRIKEKGGLVLAQSPTSARFDSMPRTVIREKMADVVGTPRELAQRLVEIVQREIIQRRARREISPQDQAYQDFTKHLFKRIKQEMGIDFTHYRATTLRRRIEKRILILQCDDFAEYEKLLEEDANEFGILSRSFLIGVTHFFRDAEFFTLLKEKILPELLERIPENETLRVWVPACSTGEEAYSYAMLIDDQLRRLNSNLDFKVLASDVDPQAIRVASEAYYGEGSVEGIPPAFLKRYFTKTFGGYQLNPYLREHMLFAVQNLLVDPPFIHLHLLSCRNFLIYINSDTQADILANFHFALEEDGVLVLGPSEGPGRLQRAFTSVDRRWKVFRRKGQGGAKFPIKKLYPNENYQTTERVRIMEQQPRERGESEKLSQDMIDPFAQYLSERFAPTAFFVDEAYHILYFNGNIDEILHFPRQYAQLKLHNVMDKETSTLLVAAVDDVLEKERMEAELGHFIVLEDVKVGNGRHTISVGKAILPDNDSSLAVVEFHPVNSVEKKGVTSTVQNSENLLLQRIQILEDKVVYAKQRSQKLLVELESTNEELQTSNRELLAANEEMQSTNEELQSVNEELYSVNNEIQRKNEELKRLNNDMNHLLESTEIGTLFLDQELNIRRFTPTIRLQFDLYPSDIGRPLSAFSSTFNNLGLVEICRGVLETRQRLEREVTDRNGNNYLLRILLYRDTELNSNGLIVTFVNISDLVDTRSELATMAAKYTAIFNSSADTFLVVSQNGRIVELSQWFDDEAANGELVGTYFVDLLLEDNQMVLFNNCLRTVVDERKVLEEQFRLQQHKEDRILHVCIIFYPIEIASPENENDEFQIMLVIKNETEKVEERQEFNFLLKEYEQKLREAGVQGGLMEIDGTILQLNQAENEGRSVEEFIKSNTFDYLSEAGGEKLKKAISKILEGSQQEMVSFQSDDFSELYPSEQMGMQYQPIVSGGEVVLILAQKVVE